MNIGTRLVTPEGETEEGGDEAWCLDVTTFRFKLNLIRFVNW